MKIQPMPKQIKKSLVISIYFILAVSTLLVFWQVRNFDFVNYDDMEYIYQNPNIQTGITGQSIKWAITAGYAANWHPLTWLSHITDWRIFGKNAGGHHVVNLIFHIANTLLLFIVLKQMTSALWQSAFVAALFALHPMHVESVAWVSERKDVLSIFFWMLTMWTYQRYVKQPGVTRYILVVLTFALGLMAKPMLVTLPFVLLLLDYWPLERFGRRTVFYLIREKIPFFILSAVSCVVTFLVQRKGGSVVHAYALLLYDRFANAFLSYAGYIAKMFCPWKLAIFYPLSSVRSPFWQIAACALLLFGISFLVVRLGRNQRYLPVGWFWFLGTLVPVIGIVQVGQQAYADRYTYIPYIGLFLMLAWGLPELLGKWRYRKIALGSSMIIVLTTLGICAHQQVSFWKNSITLFSHAIEVTQNNWLAHNNLGFAYSNLGRYTESIDAYKQAIKFNPHYAEAYFNLGNDYAALGLGAESIDAYTQAVKIRPNYAQAYCNLGSAYTKLGRYTEAIEAYKQTIKIRPNYAEAYSNLGVVYENLGRYSEAVDACKQAIKIRPDYVEAYYNLGLTYLKIGDKNSALAEYNILKSLNPRFANDLLYWINK